MQLTRAARIATWLAGVVLIVWAFSDPRFRDSEGIVSTRFCLPLAVGTALLVFGCFAWPPYRRFGGWLALAIVGQAAALQLIEAGPAIRYQHYAPVRALITPAYLPLVAVVLVQAVLVSVAFGRLWPHVWSWLRRTFGRWRLLMAALLLLVPSATVSASVWRYAAELPLAAFVQIVNLLNVVLVAASFPREALGGFERWFDRLLSGPPDGQSAGGGIDRFALTTALWVTGVASLLSIFSYERHPHIPDEVAYLFHARYFAKGMLTLPAPPVPEAFTLDLMMLEPGRWYSPVPPGWPAVLALGAVVGAPWLVNPILAGLNILLAYLLLQELAGRRDARLTVLLLCVSPWHLFMAMNFMTHTLTLTCALAAALGVARAARTGRSVWGWVAGIGVGVASLVRPLDGAILGTLLVLWASGAGATRLRIAPFAAFIVGTLLVSAVVLPYNKRLTGDPTVFPIMAYTDRYHGPNSNAFGFGPDRGWGWALDPFPGHGPLDGTVNTNLNLFSVNVDLFGWSAGSLLLIAPLLVSRRLRRLDYLMIAVVAATIATHFFYWYSGGPEFGARYWYLILLPCVVLTVRGLHFIESSLVAPGAVRRAGLAVLALCAICVLVHFPWRAIDKYHHLRGMRPDIRRLAKTHRFGRSLVFVRGRRHPDYASAATYNPLDLHADAPVYVWDQGPELRRRVLEAYPDRAVWIVNGPTVTRLGFEVHAGPLSVSDMTRLDTR